MSVDKLTEVRTSVCDRLSLSGGALLNQPDEAQLVKLKLQHRVLNKINSNDYRGTRKKGQITINLVIIRFLNWLKRNSDKNEALNF